MDFYSDNDPHAAAWMRELIVQGLIPKGNVDERSIKELTGKDVQECRRVHLFAGIGGWAEALRLAEWPRTRPVWTGSCPCQPFSAAGKRKGEADARHLWPDMFRLIQECRPATVFGEQVGGDDGYRWLAGVFDDLEAAGYVVGAADLPACSVGAPHRRYRLYFVANASAAGRQGSIQEPHETRSRPEQRCGDGVQVVADPASDRCTEHVEKPRERLRRRTGPHNRPECGDNFEGVGNAESCNGRLSGQQGQEGSEPSRPSNGDAQELGHAASAGPQEQWREYRPSGEGCSGLSGLAMQTGVPEWNGPTIAVKCSDGARRISAQSGAFPLATGLPARVVRLRGYGNAIVPACAAVFIKAFLEAEGGGVT